jgi:hypothetical protein
VPEAVRKPANQLIANLTGVMGKELLAEALVTIAGVLVGGRYVRSQSGSGADDGAGDNDAPLSAREAIGRVLGNSQKDGGQQKNQRTNKKVAHRPQRAKKPRRNEPN